MWVCNNSIYTKIEVSFLRNFSRFVSTFESFFAVFHSFHYFILFLFIAHYFLKFRNYFVFEFINKKIQKSHMCACRLLFVKLKVMENLACTKIITNLRGCSCYFVCQNENYQLWNLFFPQFEKLVTWKACFYTLIFKTGTINSITFTWLYSLLSLLLSVSFSNSILLAYKFR